MKKFIVSFLLSGALFSQDAIEVSPASLDFGNVLMGNSPTLTFTITCNLDQTITITPPSYFSVDTSEIEMVTGETQDVVVTFTPPQVGNFDSQIVLAGSTFGNAVIEVTAVAVNNLEGSLSGTILAEYSPYQISGDIFVEEGNTLNIDAGVTLEFIGAYTFKNDGVLNMNGSFDNLIYLNASLTNETGWYGIENNGELNAVYTIIKDAGKNTNLINYTYLGFDGNDVGSSNIVLGNKTNDEFGVNDITFYSAPSSYLMYYNYSYYSYENSQYWFNFNDDIFITPNTSVSFYFSANAWSIYQEQYDERDIELQYRPLDSDSWNTIATYDKQDFQEDEYAAYGQWFNITFENCFENIMNDVVKLRLYVTKNPGDSWYLDNLEISKIGISAISNISSSVLFRNSTINSNNAGITNDAGIVNIINSNILNNFNAGLSNFSGETTILNSIIFNNSFLNQFPTQLSQVLGSVSVDYSIVQNYQSFGISGNVSTGDNLLNINPMFEGEFFHLNPNYSPAIDYGHPNDYDNCMPPGSGSLIADIGMYGGMNNCGSANSNLAEGKPTISYIVDLPQDQGGLVGIQFENSFYDGGSNVYDITHYSFWRELDPDALDTNYFSIHPNGDHYRPNQRTGEYWEHIGESPAQGFDSYGYTATTLADSNHNGLFWSKYLVVAHTGDESVYFVSEPDSGYSVDNLNPDPVESLNMNFFGNYNYITWDTPTSEDYLYTKIIRDDEIVSEVYDNISFSDFDLEFSTHYLYRIVHVDENGNESETVERDVETPDWVVHLETQSDMDGVANSNFYFAAHDSATIGFDAYYDILSPPSPPGNYLRLVSQQDFYNQLTDYSYVSVDPVDLNSFTRSVNVTGTSSGINAPDGVNDQVLINAYLHGLDGIDFNISIDDGGFFTPSTIDSNEVITKQFSMYFNDNDSTHLELVLGNQTLGQPTFANFNQVEIYHGGEHDVILNTSGIDNAMLKLEMFHPDGGSSLDTLGIYTNLNSVLDTLSVDFFEDAEGDRMKGYIENAKLILDFTYSDYEYSIVSSEFSVISDTITHIYNGEWDLIHPYFGDRQITELIENATDLPYSAYVLNEENLSYEIVNFSDINTESGTSFWLKVSDSIPNSILEFDLYGSSPELNSLQSKMIRNVPGWVMVGSSVRPVSRDSILVTVYESGVGMQLSWQQAVSDSIVVNRLYGLDGAGNYSSDSITNVTKGFWVGISDTSESTDSIKLEFPIHRITQDVVPNQLFDYGIIINGLAMGFSLDASNARDSKDEVSPPRIPTNEPQVELFHPEWDFSLGDYFLSDVRDYPTTDYEEFPIKFSNSGQIKLEPQFIDLPSEWGAALVFGGQQINFVNNEEITINVQNNDVGVIILGDLEQLSIDLGNNLPSQYALHQNYPNPFNPTTTLRYDIPEDSHVSITIFDMLGNKVTNLVNDNQKSGFKSVKWNAINDKGESVSAGVYIYRIQAGGFSSTKKMILLK